METSMRTHMCAELAKENINEVVTLTGWVQRRRDLGGLIFVDLRDRTGIIQVLFGNEINKDILTQAANIRNEYVLQVKGKVVKRDERNINPNIPTGEVEVVCTDLNILDSSETTPIYIEDEDNTNETTRLKYRYLDLRKPKMQKNIIIRHKASKITRDFLNEHNFIEIETPMLTKPTPEGARDYLVPSRVQKGKFFALPQSPQLYKQILMVSGLDRYYQIVRCFRDEDLRQDRQPEFTQIDIEMSFINENDIISLNEKLITKIFKEILNIEVSLPLKRMTYKEAMERFGSDKPDTRFGYELIDLTDIVADSDFKVFNSTITNGGHVRAINAKECANKFSRREIDSLGEYAKIYKAKGLAWIKVTKEGIVSPIAKFLSSDETNNILGRTNAEEGDLLLIIADKPQIVFDALGQLRLELARKLELNIAGQYEFLWVTEFPLLEFDEESNRYVAKHHPFTSPIEEDVHLLESDPSNVRAKAYDLVVNGVELGGGSIRIHRKDLQEKVFNTLGFTNEEAWSKFGFLLEAFKYGTPPHGGIAFGLDRLIMLLTGTDNIKDVIAFPKTQNHGCLMTDAPAISEEDRLVELGITIKE